MKNIPLVPMQGADRRFIALRIDKVPFTNILTLSTSETLDPCLVFSNRHQTLQFPKIEFLYLFVSRGYTALNGQFVFRGV